MVQTFSCSLSWHKGMSHESESGYTRSRERASITSTAILYTLQSRMLDTVDREIMNVSKLLTPKGVMLDIHRDHVLGQTLHPIFAPSCTRTNGTYTWLDIYPKLLICLRFPFPLPGILSWEWRREKSTSVRLQEVFCLACRTWTNDGSSMAKILLDSGKDWCQSGRWDTWDTVCVCVRESVSERYGVTQRKEEMKWLFVKKARVTFCSFFGRILFISNKHIKIG